MVFWCWKPRKPHVHCDPTAYLPRRQRGAHAPHACDPTRGLPRDARDGVPMRRVHVNQPTTATTTLWLPPGNQSRGRCKGLFVHKRASGSSCFVGCIIKKDCPGQCRPAKAFSFSIYISLWGWGGCKKMSQTRGGYQVGVPLGRTWDHWKVK